METFKKLFNSENIDIFLPDKVKANIWHYAANYGRLEILKEISSKTHEKINDCNIIKILNDVLILSNTFDVCCYEKVC